MGTNYIIASFYNEYISYNVCFYCEYFTNSKIPKPNNVNRTGNKKVRIKHAYNTIYWFLVSLIPCPPMAVAAQSKTWVCRRSLAGIVGSTAAEGHGCSSLVSIVCCQAEVSASGWSLEQRSPTECGASECDHESLIMSRTWPTRGCCTIVNKHWPA